MVHARVLIVDDEEDMLTGLQRTLERNIQDLEVVTATRPSQALRLMAEQSFDLALLDVMMPEMNGIALLEKLRQKDPELSVVMMTAFASIDLAVEAIRKGAYDFITKPFEKDTILRVINKGLERNRLVRENVTLKKQVCQQEAFASFVGKSPAMEKFYERLKIVALSDYTVLVRGESGTGKELTARAIHNLSKRRNRPLVMVNCPAIPEHLLESELFGYKRGAFTGADRDYPGLFLSADGGSICLDEIADIPVSVQTKLLRVLQEQEVRPLGDTRTRRINVRIIAITNQNLEKKILDRSFREDLFYRLNVVALSPPRLFQIADDIPLLIDHFCKKVCCELGVDERHFSPESVTALKGRNWPGNIRELQNVVRQAILFSAGPVISAQDLQAFLSPDSALPGRNSAWQAFGGNPFPEYKEAKEDLLQKFMGEYVKQALQVTHGNVSRAADLSGLTRAALQKIMQRIDIKADDFRRGPS
ncbi:MAG: sigma-54-dependent Fis family transcriptional regulator [Chlorobium sp.]|jgi:DNA-binding NtrC family response regulator|nr:sigma-54-dependent Fis family transcriptional regulator [Chlorobium sp.]